MSQAIVHRGTIKELFLKIAKSYRKTHLGHDFLLIVTGLQPATLKKKKKRFQLRWFPVNFAKFLRTAFFPKLTLGDCIYLSVDKKKLIFIGLVFARSKISLNHFSPLFQFSVSIPPPHRTFLGGIVMENWVKIS